MSKKSTETKSGIEKSIMEEFHLDKLPTKEQEEILIRVGGIVYQAILLRCLETMSDDKQTELEKMIDDKASQEDLLDFLDATVPDFQTIVDEEVQKFIDESHSVMNKALKE